MLRQEFVMKYRRAFPPGASWEEYRNVVVEADLSTMKDCEKVGNIVGTAFICAHSVWPYKRDGYTLTPIISEQDITKFRAIGRYSSWDFEIVGPFNPEGPW